MQLIFPKSKVVTQFLTPLVASLIAMSSYATGKKPDSGVSFTNISAAIDFQRKPGAGPNGVAWIDYDNDDDLDLLLTNNRNFENGLFRNDGGNQFTNVSQKAGLTALTGNAALAVGDIDNDGYPDILMAGTGGLGGPLESQSPTLLYHNNGDGTFADISETANVVGPKTTMAIAMADINNDGYLDIFMSAPGHLGIAFPPAEQHTDRLYLNNGDLTFTDITESAGVLGGLGSCVASFSDYDTDGWIDLYVGVCNDVNFAPTPFHLYRNNGDNTFTDIATEVGIDKLGFWMAVALSDYDNDGHIDLFATNSGSLGQAGNNPHVLYRNNGDGTYTDVTPLEIASSEFSWGATFSDFDNDGYTDLFFTGALPPPPFNAIGPGRANPGRLFFNDKQGGFIQDNAAHGLDLSSEFTSGVAQADFDNNGFPDFAVANSQFLVRDPTTGTPTVSGTGRPVLMQNAGNNNHWLTVQLKGGKSNSMGIGARISVYTFGYGRHLHQVREIRAGSSFASSETPWPTFGLGKNRFAFLKVAWPSGLIEWHPFVRAGKKVVLIEGNGIIEKQKRR